ncbi:unnamed protein product, partial [Darwinula stevensoni]
PVPGRAGPGSPAPEIPAREEAARAQRLSREGVPRRGAGEGAEQPGPLRPARGRGEGRSPRPLEAGRVHRRDVRRVIRGSHDLAVREHAEPGPQGRPERLAACTAAQTR